MTSNLPLQVSAELPAQAAQKIPTALSVPGALASPTISLVACAFAKAQGAMGNAKRTSTNPNFGSKYADLASVIEAIGDSMSSNGLSYFQRAHAVAGQIAIETLIIHESGEFLSAGVLSVPIAGLMNIQDHGAAITYVRRYALQTALGIATEEDDGNAAAAAGGNSVPVTVTSVKPQNAPVRAAPVGTVASPPPASVVNPPVAQPAVAASVPAAAPATTSTPLPASTASEPNDAEVKDLELKIAFVNSLEDSARLISAKLRAESFFKTASLREKFIKAIDNRVGILNATAAQPA